MTTVRDLDKAVADAVARYGPQPKRPQPDLQLPIPRAPVSLFVLIIIAIAGYLFWLIFGDV